MMPTYLLHFEGSLSDNDRSFLPMYGGVYLVYRGVWSEKDKLFFCHEIIYIGKADCIKQRLLSHERRTDFLSACHPGEIIFYSFAKAYDIDVNRIEAALIYHTKPRLNESGKDTFLYNPTHIVSDGACALLDVDIIAE